MKLVRSPSAWISFGYKRTWLRKRSMSRLSPPSMAFPDAVAAAGAGRDVVLG